jgi:hypothetical protein
MARWIYQRPVDCCHPTELVVAKRLARLGDEWVIRCGFYYEARHNDQNFISESFQDRRVAAC